MKSKVNRKGDTKRGSGYDSCYTPDYALDPLLPYLKKDWVLWESAVGNGQMYSKLIRCGFDVVWSDIVYGQNFFEYNQEQNYDCQITNPPYSVKYEWLERSYQLKKPFALILPIDTLGAKKGQRLFEKYGIEIILLDKRVNFFMPNKGYNTGGAQFSTAWFTWGLNIDKQITFGKMNRYKDEPNIFHKPEMKNQIEISQLSLFDNKEGA